MDKTKKLSFNYSWYDKTRFPCYIITQLFCFLTHEHMLYITKTYLNTNKSVMIE